MRRVQRHGHARGRQGGGAGDAVGRVGAVHGVRRHSLLVRLGLHLEVGVARRGARTVRDAVHLARLQLLLMLLRQHLHLLELLRVEQVEPVPLEPAAEAHEVAGEEA